MSEMLKERRSTITTHHKTYSFVLFFADLGFDNGRCHVDILQIRLGISSGGHPALRLCIVKKSETVRYHEKNSIERREPNIEVVDLLGHGIQDLLVRVAAF